MSMGCDTRRTARGIIAGLAPIMWSAGAGADVMKRVAAPMVGGMLTTTGLTLLVIPAVYLLWRRWEVRRGLATTTNRDLRTFTEGATP